MPEGEFYSTTPQTQFDKHHIYPGANRKVSEKYGFFVWILHDLHNGNNPNAVHNNPNTGYDLMLKVKCQEVYEQTHSRADFMKLIGRNYLEED